MTSKRGWLAWAAVGWALLLAGCATIESRIQKESAAFAALSPDDQARVREGRIELGDAPAVVFVALGEPDRKRKVRTAEGTFERWEYRRYYLVDDGPRFTGYERRIVRDTHGRVVAAYAVPLYVRQAYWQSEPSLLVDFAGGVVSAIDETTSG